MGNSRKQGASRLDEAERSGLGGAELGVWISFLKIFKYTSWTLAISKLVNRGTCDFFQITKKMQ